jgi:hypothetical protein
LGFRVAPPLAGDNLYGYGILEPVRVIFEAILQPAAGEDSVEAVAKHFRTTIKRNRTEVHIVDRLALDPLIASMGRAAAIVREMHVGNVNAYAAYLLMTILFVLIVGAGLF